MGILSVQERKGARSNINDQGVTEYTRTFQVITDSPLVGAATVRTATGIPRRFDIYATATEFDTLSVATKVTVEQDSDNPRLWIVTVDYGVPSINEDQQDPNPLLRPAVLSWNFQKATRAVYKDVNDKAIQNSAGEYFIPCPEIDDSRPVLTVSRNEASFNPAIAIQYQDAINSDGFLGFTAGQVKVAGIQAQSQTENSKFFWAVQYEFEFRRDGWQLILEDLGRNRKWTDGDPPAEEGKLQAIIVSGVPASDAIPLNGSGQPLLNPSPTNRVPRPFDVYKSLPFSTLGLS
ncbi:MAG TPA: hypothetical protein VGI40_18055 [Pirellulaceae bacterium]|jgi:hypothetical protein